MTDATQAEPQGADPAGAWRLSVDRDVCIGSGMCASLDPAHFRLVEHKSSPVTERIEPSDDAVDAAENCPVEAILIADAATGETVAPLE